MMKKTLLQVLALLIGFGVVLGATTASGEPVRMSYLQDGFHHLPLWVALEKGFFKDHGVDVKIAGIFRAGPETMSAFSAGSLDMAYLGIAPVITAVANKAAQVKIVAGVNLNGSAIVVPPTSSLRGIPDLRGESVAIPGISTVQDFLLKKALADNGIEAGDVNTIVLKPPEMLGALQTGQIDSCLPWEPFPAKAITSGIGRVLVTSKQIWPNHPCCVLVADKRFVDRHGDEIKAIVAAHLDGIEFIKKNPEEAIKIAVKYTGMDEKTIRLALNNVTYSSELNLAEIKEYLRLLNESKYSKIDDPDAFVQGLLELKWLGELRSK